MSGTHSNQIKPTVDQTATRYVYLEGSEFTYNIFNLQDNLNLSLNNSITEPTSDAAATENNSGGSSSAATNSENSTSTYSTTEIQIQAPPLVIHTGTQANQSISINLNDMHTKFLKNNVPS